MKEEKILLIILTTSNTILYYGWKGIGYRYIYYGHEGNTIWTNFNHFKYKCMYFGIKKDLYIYIMEMKIVPILKKK